MTQIHRALSVASILFTAMFAAVITVGCDSQPDGASVLIAAYIVVCHTPSDRGARRRQWRAGIE